MRNILQTLLLMIERRLIHLLESVMFLYGVSTHMPVKYRQSVNQPAV
jgi:hypothetical protein